MSIVTAGLLITFSGILVVFIGLFDFIPNSTPTVGIGWLFIIIGVVIRIIGMKVEKKYKK